MGAVYLGATVDEKSGRVTIAYAGDCEYMRINRRGKVASRSNPHTFAEMAKAGRYDLGDRTENLDAPCNFVAIRDGVPSETVVDVVHDRASRGDRLIFTSDGIINLIGADNLALNSPLFDSPAEYRDALIDSIVKLGTEQGISSDNLALIIYDPPGALGQSYPFSALLRGLWSIPGIVSSFVRGKK